jgi:hypothetical protein
VDLAEGVVGVVVGFQFAVSIRGRVGDGVLMVRQQPLPAGAVVGRDEGVTTSLESTIELIGPVRCRVTAVPSGLKTACVESSWSAKRSFARVV